MRIAGPCLAALLAVLAAGCALSPQTIGIHPVLDVAAPAIGHGRALALEVVDQRAAADFGARGGVYATATVAPRNEVAGAVRAALAERLQAMQFQLAPPGAAAPVQLRVEVLRIDYRALGEPVVNEVRAGAEVRGVVRNAGFGFTGQYRANSARQVVGPPGGETNEAIVNEILSQALQRLLSDRGVLDALAR